MMTQKKVKKKLKVKDDSDDNIMPDGFIGYIPKDLYWEWRTSVSELEAAKFQAELKRSQQLLMSKEIEIMKYKELQMRALAMEANDTKAKYKDQLDDVRKKMSEHIGTPMEGCIINEALQVLRLSDDKPSLHGSA